MERSLSEIRATTMRTLLDAHARAMRAAIDEALESADPAERQRRIPEVAARYVDAAGRWGETGEIFAFDERGAILNPGHAGETTPLSAQLGEGSGSGVKLEPYANARSAEVIAAWRWMPELRLGLAIEMGTGEAYAPLQYLRIAFGVIFGALVVAVAAALFSGLSMLSLRRQLRGRRIGPYVLDRLIGEGGMANVYLARHDLLKRPTAVKLLKPARASEEMIVRFEREVQLASRLAHPNTVEIFDYGRTRDGLFYYAMEYLDGLNVTEVVQRSGPIPVARAIHLLRQACAGLVEAHKHGIVHRDVKPENLMVCRRGGAFDVVKILDFGLVKRLAGEESRDITKALKILGTPLYMSPERLRDPTDVDARADIYALGAVAFFMLTGKRMFEAQDDLAMTTHVLNDEPPRAAAVATQAIPPELDLLVAACVEKRREDRPQRMADLLEALSALAGDHPWTERDAESWWMSIPSRNPL